MKRLWVGIVLLAGTACSGSGTPRAPPATPDVNSLTRLVLPAGDSHCPTGGISVTVNGGAVEYVCNGSTGPQGAAGAQGSAGAQGPAGGHRVLDANGAVVGDIVGGEGVHLSIVLRGGIIFRVDLGTGKVDYLRATLIFEDSLCAGTPYIEGSNGPQVGFAVYPVDTPVIGAPVYRATGPVVTISLPRVFNGTACVAYYTTPTTAQRAEVAAYVLAPFPAPLTIQ
jgi:hypothetical protein